MRFLLDENIPRDLAVTLRLEGHDVSWVPDTGMRGAKDDVLWRSATDEQRILITADLGIPQLGAGPAALIVVRHFDRLSTMFLAGSVLAAVKSLGDKMLGRHVTVAPGRVRTRRLRQR